MSARRVVDQMPDMLGLPLGSRGAAAFMSGAGRPLPLAPWTAEADGEGACPVTDAEVTTVTPIATAASQWNIFTVGLLE
jgi:hypothetical protein